MNMLPPTATHGVNSDERLPLTVWKSMTLLIDSLVTQ